MIRILMAVAVLAGGCAAGSNGKAARGGTSAARASESTQVRLGIDSFIENPPAVVRGKRGGLITNHTGMDSQGRSDVDLLREMDAAKLVALYAPEHGIRGDAAAGEKIATGVDAGTGLPVYSIYGEVRKPTPAMLKDVDVLMFD